jgi:hypothetical protein
LGDFSAVFRAKGIDTGAKLLALEAAELAGMGVEGDPLDVCTPLGLILATIVASFLSLSLPPTFFSSLFLEPLPSISLLFSL